MEVELIWELILQKLVLQELALWELAIWQVLYFCKLCKCLQQNFAVIKHIDLWEWLLVGVVIANKRTIDIEPERELSLQQ